MANLRHRLVQLLDHREHLQRGDEAVAGRRVVGQDDVAGRFAADVVAVLAHVLEHITVADRHAHQRELERLQIALKAEIGHHRCDDARLGEPPIVLPAFGNDRQQLVAVDHMALLVGDDDAVGVAVERDADVGAHLAHLAAQSVGKGRAAFAVDVEAVRLDADRNDVGAELPKRFRRDAIGRAVGAVDDDAQTFERKVARQGALGEFDVAVVYAVNSLGAAECFGSWPAAW